MLSLVSFVVRLEECSLHPISQLGPHLGVVALCGFDCVPDRHHNRPSWIAAAPPAARARVGSPGRAHGVTVTSN